ncbi:ZIP family metal transporter [Streptomyces sp. NPDC059781]|uniref:ZIP family metal transporter n=1 Tax=Streptomyces sp. NPDC059781 TaxID=3346943 RepID=UPI0036583D9F
MAVLVALGAFLMTLAGGWSAHRVTDRRHLVLGLAGGLMLGVVGLELLPESLEAAGTEVYGVPAALLLFVAGFLLAHLVERLLAHRQAAHGAAETVSTAPPPGRLGRCPAADRAQPSGAPRSPTLERTRAEGPPCALDTDASLRLRDGRTPEVGLTAAAAMVGHSAMDGVAIGAAFQVGGGMGAAVAVAVIAHDFADGFNTYTLTRVYGNARRRALMMLFADAAAPVVGAASTLFLTIPEPLLGGYLGLFGGALLYLAAAEILPEAHHEHPARSTLLCTIAGALFIWLVVGAAH